MSSFVRLGLKLGLGTRARMESGHISSLGEAERYVFSSVPSVPSPPICRLHHHHHHICILLSFILSAFSADSANFNPVLIPSQVILGGTRGINDWHPHPRPSTTSSILSRNLSIHLHLIPPSRLAQLQAEGKEPSVEDILPLVIESGCGLRPGRRGGIRLERGVLELSAGGGKVKVVYNYG